MRRSVTASGLALALASCAALGQSTPSVIYACVGSNGTLQIVAAGTPCKKNETALSWNSTGSTGPSGPAGPRGPSNAFVASNFSAALGSLSTDPASPTGIVTLQVPAGSYVLNGVVGLYADIALGTLVPFANVSCGFTTSAGPIGAMFRMLVGGKATSYASVPMATALTLTDSDAVTIECVAEGASGVQISTQPSVLTAIQVDALSSQ